MSPTLVPQPNIKDQCTIFVIIINGKLSNGQRIGKDRSTSQFQGRAVPKNAPTTVQLHSSHTVAMLCSKSYKVGFSSMWTENSQKYMLDFEAAEELETKLLTCTGLWRKPEGSRKTSTFASLTMQVFDCVDHNKLWQILILKELGVPDHLIYRLRNLYLGQEATLWNN